MAAAHGPAGAWTRGGAAPSPARPPGPGTRIRARAAPDPRHLPPVSAGRGLRRLDAAGAAERLQPPAESGGARRASAVPAPGPRRVTPWPDPHCGVREGGGAGSLGGRGSRVAWARPVTAPPRTFQPGGVAAPRAVERRGARPLRPSGRAEGRPGAGGPRPGTRYLTAGSSGAREADRGDGLLAHYPFLIKGSGKFSSFTLEEFPRYPSTRHTSSSLTKQAQR